MISGNEVYVVLNLRGGRRSHLALDMTAKEYRAQTGLAFLPTQNPGNYPQSMVIAQEQAFVTEKF